MARNNTNIVIFVLYQNDKHYEEFNTIRTVH